ncbi:MAG: hypothetical protein KAW87_06550 [Candidatus Cloacimonetes bacterium]|nr:hypothetical protein [Candidatus Cloacimonadota bacterium]
MRDDKPKILTITDYTRKLVNEASREILKYTLQLYHKDNKTEPVRPEPWASAVLLKVDNTRFLLTSGHVLQENGQDINPEDIGIMIEDTFQILNGEIKYVNSTVNKTSDRIDLAIWRLNDDVAGDLEKQYKFLEPSQVDIDHNVSTEPRYLLVGFPVTRSKIKPATAIIKVAPFIFLTKESEKNLYKKLDFEEHSNIILDYRKAKIKSFDTGLPGQGPDTHGVSGSGLWYLPTLIVAEGQKVPFKLAGIMIEWRREVSAVIATRIHIATEIIRKEFRLNLPQSKITKVN